MNYTLWQRLKNWHCEQFGHKAAKIPVPWMFNGKRHFVCKCCGYLKSEDIK